MERIVNFGSFTVNQQLDLLENRLKKGDILLFRTMKNIMPVP